MTSHASASAPDPRPTNHEGYCIPATWSGNPPDEDFLESSAHDTTVTMTDQSLFYLYAHEGAPEMEMETAWDTSISGAYEGFLLEHLGSVQQWPTRCEWVGPMGWDLMDPLGKALPAVVIVTRDRKRFMVGYANWSEAVPRTHAEQWAALGTAQQNDVKSLWSRLQSDY